MPDARMSRGDLLALVAVLALAGVVVSAYLTWESYQAEKATWCDLNSFFSCSAVGASAYAHVGPVPTAAVGLGGFVILFALAALAFRGVEHVWRWSPEQWLLLFAVAGSLIGLALTVIEVFVIHAVCLLCATGFALDLGILGLAVLLRRAA